jgi:hypothetical protein
MNSYRIINIFPQIFKSLLYKPIFVFLFSPVFDFEILKTEPSITVVLKAEYTPDIVVHTCNPSIQEAETRGSRVQLAWAT